MAATGVLPQHIVRSLLAKIMKKLILIILIINIPTIALCQIDGDWIFWGGMVVTNFELKNNGQFHYSLSNDTFGELGEGNYSLDGDTITFNFNKYSDSSKFDCSSLKQISLDRKNLEDSINISIMVSDCSESLPLGFIEVKLYDKISGNLVESQTLITNNNGECQFNLPLEKDYPLILVLGNGHYGATEIIVDPSQNLDLRIEVGMFWGYYALISPEKVMRFRIKERDRKYLVLESLDFNRKGEMLLFKSKPWWSWKKKMRILKKYYPEKFEYTEKG